MHPLLVFIVPAYLGAMALAIVGLAAAIVPAQIRRRRDRMAAGHPAADHPAVPIIAG